MHSPAEIDRIDEVLPYLAIGSYGAAEQEWLLVHAGVTHAIALAGFVPVAVQALPLLDLPLSDDGDSLLIEALILAIPFIEQARARGGKVPIFCALGVTRSPALVAGYLRRALGWTTAASLARVASCRPIASIHQRYLDQLERL